MTYDTLTGIQVSTNWQKTNKQGIVAPYHQSKYPEVRRHKQIIYAASSYVELRRENGYFVDKTEYSAKLERIKNPILLRPRRFGESFICSMVHCYYDLRYKDDFFDQSHIYHKIPQRTNKGLPNEQISRDQSHCSRLF